MMAVTASPKPCLCGSVRCETPEARAYRATLEAEQAANHALNHRAFVLYLADRDAGLPLRPLGEYRALAEKETDRS